MKCTAGLVPLFGHHEWYRKKKHFPMKDSLASEIFTLTKRVRKRCHSRISKQMDSHFSPH